MPTGPAATAGTIAAVPGYEIIRELGRGGMGVVYQARHIKLNRLVAMKMILAGSHAGAADLARFQTEAEAIARLQHPNIAQIYEVGEQDGRPFFSLEFCGGGSLDRKLGGVPLPPKEAARLAETLARAMHAAHEAGVVHRDLKPANVLLTKDGTPKITDFGLGKKLDEAGQTASGAIMGTPSYMAPEQAGGKSAQIGPRTDVYALGAILYEFLTGRPPFRAATGLDTVLQVVSDESVPPTQLQPKTPRDLETICLKCLQKEPAKRYGSAAALAEDLRRFQKGEPIRARPVGRVERAWRWGRQNPLGAGLVAALLLGTTGTTALAVWALGERHRAEQETGEKAWQLKRAERMVYANQIALAQAAWNENRADVARDYPDRTRPEYRGWEHEYLSVQFLRNQRIFRGHTGWVNAVAFSPDGKRVASAGDNTVRLWDARTGQQAHALKARTTGDMTAVTFRPDGRRVAGACGDGTVYLWDAETGKEVLTLTGHIGPVNAVAYSPDGKRLASGGKDQSVRVWDAEVGREVRALNGHTGMVTAVAFSPDGKRLASTAADLAKPNKPGEVKVWDADKGQELFSVKRQGGNVWGVAFSPDGKIAASAT